MIQEEHIFTGVIIDDNWQATFTELCQTCDVDAELVIRMIEHGLLEPQGQSDVDWRFDAKDLRRLQKALRLYRDLQINLNGIALALDLMEEIESLREKIKRLENYE